MLYRLREREAHVLVSFEVGECQESVSHFILSAHLQNDLQWDSGNADSHQGSDTSWGHGAPPPVSREMRIAALIGWDLSAQMKANFGSLEASGASY